MSGLRILLTGATSFTGCHIARALLEQGHDVLATLTRNASDYQEALVKTRLAHASGLKFVHQAPFGSDVFREALGTFRPQILINHGADIKGYRDPSFDVSRFVRSATLALDETLAEFRNQGGRRVIHSGTVFEPIDGLSAQSVYGESKSQVASIWAASAQRVGVAFTKILIANPVGPFENEDRLIPIFVKKWKSGEKPTLTAPKMLWDNIPAQWLARRYVEAAEAVSAPALVRPSGFKIPLRDFVDRFVDEAKRRGVRLDFAYEIPAQVPDAPAQPRFNEELCPEMNNSQEVDRFFDEWIVSHWPEARRLSAS